MLFSALSNLPPLIVSYIYADGMASVFTDSLLIVFSIGFLMWLATVRSQAELSTRDGFLVVTLFWAVLGVAGSLPFIFSSAVELSVTDAVFESLSGLTTTGATVISGLDDLPKSILFYRQQLQWLGGMGIIVLAMALLPMLGIGGMQLYRAESPGPVKDNKLVPQTCRNSKGALVYLSHTNGCLCARILDCWHGSIRCD